MREKELRQKELMKMMSVNESDIGWAWFSTFAVFNVASAFLSTIASSVLYEHSDPGYLFVFWIVTFVAFTTFTMAMATGTSKAARATLLGLLGFFCGAFLNLA